MDKIASFNTEFSSIKFSASIFQKENGLIIDIVGPNEHLGGIGIGIPYSRKNNSLSANYSCFSFPSHRDGELAGKIAQIIAKLTRFPTVVLLGLHIPDLTRETLESLTRFFENWAKDLGNQLQSKLSKIQIT